MTYKFKPEIYAADPDAVKQELSDLEKEGGVIDPAAIIEKAKSSKSAMHEMFCWDDTEAAQRYRLIQAQQLLRVFIFETSMKQENGEVVVVESRVYEKAPDGYKQVMAIAQSPDEWAFLLADVRGELSAARNKLNRLLLLGSVKGATKAKRSVESAIKALGPDK